MMWREIGYLCKEAETTFDKFNKPIKGNYIETEVFCNKKSVKQNEFYQAQAQGLKPELVIEVKTYDGSDHFKFENKLYRIIRTYSKNDEVIELVLTSTLVNIDLRADTSV